MQIDTKIKPVTVEIEGQTYPVAAKTVELLEKMRRVEEIAIKNGRMQYEMEIEQLKLLLGRRAARALFAGGGKVNADRVDAIYFGVLDAFDAEGRRLRKERSDAVAAEFRALSEAIAPISELTALLRGDAAGAFPRIPKPETARAQGGEAACPTA